MDHVAEEIAVGSEEDAVDEAVVATEEDKMDLTIIDRWVNLSLCVQKGLS